MTIDDLYNAAAQETGNAASHLKQEVDSVKTDQLSRDDWTNYWHNMGYERQFRVTFHPVLNYGGQYSDNMMNMLYPPERVTVLVEKYIQMIDIVTYEHSDIRVERDSISGELTLDVMFMPGNQRRVLWTFINMWKLFGQFSQNNYSPSVTYISLIDQNPKTLVNFRSTCATLDAMRENERDRSVKSHLDEKDIDIIVTDLLNTGFFAADITYEDVARLVFEHMRKSLNLNSGTITKLAYLPDWTSTQLDEIMKYKALTQK